ncbi:hypothetical protein FKW77_002876 [Venturia effusa]|uniref:Cytochrome c oxidase subunit 12, mitochondrial n=1 Tax=Venturia effusa TaxID=50376 RepID=A0A517LDF7_9PEZI|nr:hypothetical protein FKW77_002876 [Venturia effusa]
MAKNVSPSPSNLSQLLRTLMLSPDVSEPSNISSVAFTTLSDHGLTAPGTIGFDARFPNQNQTKHCWQNYVDYHKCITARGEDFPPCRQFFLAFKSLCPSAWVARWDDQRDV